MNLAVLGGGQLGRLIGLAALPLGVRCVFLDPSASCSAGAIGRHICAPFDDDEAIGRLTDRVAAATVASDRVDPVAVHSVATGTLIRPGARSIVVGHDRLAQLALFRECGVPTIATASIASKSDVAAALACVGTACRLTPRRPSESLSSPPSEHIRDATCASVEAEWEVLARVPCVLERTGSWADAFTIVATRGRASGEVRSVFYGASTTEWRGGAPIVTRARAGHGRQIEAVSHVRRIMDELDHVGTMAVDFAESPDGLVALSLSPLPHASAQWTMDCSSTSQYENTVRAVFGWPLGRTDMVGFPATVHLQGRVPDVSAMLAVPEATVHLYGSGAREARSSGHINVRADSVDSRERAIATLLAIVARAS